MFASLVDNNHMLHNMKSPLTNGYGLLDRDSVSYLSSDRQVSQISQGMMEQKELMMRGRSEMLMRQNEMLARQHNVMVDPKHYMPSSSIGLESASELLGKKVKRAILKVAMLMRYVCVLSFVISVLGIYFDFNYVTYIS